MAVPLLGYNGPNTVKFNHKTTLQSKFFIIFITPLPGYKWGMRSTWLDSQKEESKSRRPASVVRVPLTLFIGIQRP